ncbi:MAG: hypothetical protein V2J25_02175 [Desulfatiglans sp.]|jgi:hypothetical protein|nr:hypothetical protein [Thermodesulfobacteriota bacterium]MEE4351652.1 hypothetical protein [Desulfatiglans sp.]
MNIKIDREGDAMKRRLVTMLCVLVVSVCMVNVASGFDLGDIMIHGFMSQGYMKSSDNNFIGNTEEGTYEFHEIGINLGVPLTDELRFGAQLFSRDIGEYGNNDVTIDWAFLAYEWKDWLKLRLGKVKLPYGFYNGKRDADMLRTSTLLPQSVYPESIRDFVVSFNGVSAYGNLDIGAFGDLDYEVFMGTVDIESDNPFMRNLLSLIGMGLITEGIDPIDYWLSVGGEMNDLDIDVSHFEGGQLIWNLPIAGLRLGGSYLQGKGDVTSGALDAEISLDSIAVLSAEYETGPFILTGEYLNLDCDIGLPFLPPYSVGIEGWYGSVSWQVNEWLRLGASYGEYYPNSDDKDGRLFVGAGLRDYYAWQKDTTLSVRFDLNDYWCLKMETHFINGVAQCDLAENPGIMEEDWTLYTLKTSLAF